MVISWLPAGAVPHADYLIIEIVAEGGSFSAYGYLSYPKHRTLIRNALATQARAEHEGLAWAEARGAQEVEVLVVNVPS